MNHRVAIQGIRWLFAVGLAVMFVAAIVAGAADGVGDRPPILQVAGKLRRMGVAIVAGGLAVTVGAVVRLYIVENKACR